MTLPPRARKVALTTHVVSSVGWLGAVAAFLVVAIAGLTSQDVETVRAAYVSTELTTWFAIVPLCAASLVSGVVQALGSTWGLFRHWWVLIKLLLTVFATVVLVVQLEPIGYLGEQAAGNALSTSDLREERLSLMVHASGGLLVLLTAATLSIFKPPGLTRYGRRKRSA